jgi:hypothetical protein
MSGTDSWVSYTLDVTIATDCTGIEFFIYISKETAGDVLYLDDIEVYKTKTGYPVLTNLYDAYVSGGQAQQHWQIIPATEADRTGRLAGLGHLEGEDVVALVDGANHPAVTVDTGSVELQTHGNIIHLGLPYTSKMSPLRIETPSTSGPSLGKIKRIHQVTTRFYKSLGALIGPDEDDLTIIHFRSGDDPMDSAPPLYTGDIVVDFDGPYSSDCYLVIVQEQPLPLVVCGFAIEMHTKDET